MKRKIRVAINAISDLSSRYGSYVYLIELARALVSFGDIDLYMLVGRGETRLLPEELRRQAQEIAVPTSRSYWQPLYHGRIKRFLLQKDVDVYHLPNSLPFFWRTIPTVVSIHDLAELRLKKYGRLRTSYRRLINRSAAKLADHILTLSENSRNDISTMFDIPPEKMTVTFAGVDQRFRPRDRVACKENVRRVHRVTSDFLLAPGGLSQNKNVPNLLSAFSEIRKSNLHLSLVLTGYGSPDEVRQVSHQIDNLGLKGCVTLTGYVDTDQIPFLYGACSAVIYPSLYEGFGLPAVEAMASGRPLIVSNTSSLPEVTGDAALLVDPHDPHAIALAVKRLLENAELRDTLVSKGLARAELFTWQRTAALVNAVYQRLATAD